MISWFVLTLASVGEIAEYAAAHLQLLEDAGKPAGKFTYTFWPWMNSLKAFFFLQEEGFQVRTTLSLFTVNARRLRQLPSVDMSMPNRHAQLRIGPIVRRVRNTDIRNAYQKSSHIYLRLLLDIRTSSYALNHIQTITMVYAIQLLERRVSGIRPFLYYPPQPPPPPSPPSLPLKKVKVHVWKEMYSRGGIAI